VAAARLDAFKEDAMKALDRLNADPRGR